MSLLRTIPTAEQYHPQGFISGSPASSDDDDAAFYYHEGGQLIFRGPQLRWGGASEAKRVGLRLAFPPASSTSPSIYVLLTRAAGYLSRPSHPDTRVLPFPGGRGRERAVSSEHSRILHDSHLHTNPDWDAFTT